MAAMAAVHSGGSSSNQGTVSKMWHMHLAVTMTAAVVAVALAAAALELSELVIWIYVAVVCIQSDFYSYG